MGDEREEKALETEAPSESHAQPPHTTDESVTEAAGEAVAEKGNSVAEKRGRMVMTGLVAVVILSVIAVLVAGVFQLTSKWLIPCPTDLPVNDPAPILWNKVVSERVTGEPLGVSGKIEAKAMFKSGKSVSEPSGADSADKQENK